MEMGVQVDDGKVMMGELVVWEVVTVEGSYRGR